MTARWQIPQGLKVGADGSWTVGGFRVVHVPTLCYLKQRLVFDDDGAWVIDGPQRLRVQVEGPAFVVRTLVVDDEHEEVRALLDDGSEETVCEGALALDDDSGRFTCEVRGGRARALLSRGAHQAVLARVDDETGAALRAGSRRIPIRH